MNSGPRPPRPGGGGGKPNNKFKRTRRKPCMFCVDHATSVDYKQMILGRYKTKLVSDRGKIVPRRTTGTCAKHQRMVTEAIKRARHVALIPFAVE